MGQSSGVNLRADEFHNKVWGASVLSNPSLVCHCAQVPFLLLSGHVPWPGLPLNQSPWLGKGGTRWCSGVKHTRSSLHAHMRISWNISSLSLLRVLLGRCLSVGACPTWCSLPVTVVYSRSRSVGLVGSWRPLLRLSNSSAFAHLPEHTVICIQGPAVLGICGGIGDPLTSSPSEVGSGNSLSALL